MNNKVLLLILLLFSFCNANYLDTIESRIEYKMRLCMRGIGNLELLCEEIAFLEEYVRLNNEHVNILDDNRDVLNVCELFKSTVDVSMLLNFGTVYATSGKYFEAILILNEVVRIDPLRDKAYNNLALISDALNSPDRELYYLNKAIEVNPENTQALRSLSQHYYDKDEMELCLKYARKAALLGNIACRNWLDENGYPLAE